MKIVLSNMGDVEDFVSMLSPNFISLIKASDAALPKLTEQINNLVVHVDGTLPADIAKPADPYTDMAAAVYGHDLHPEGYRPEELPTAASADKAVVETSAALREHPIREHEIECTHRQLEEGLINDQFAAAQLAVLTGVELDSTGRRWDEEIDSAAKTKTKAGAWTRSRRRDLTDERYNERVAELLAEALAERGDPVPDEEPVATERHALPVDEVTHVALTDNAPDSDCKVAEAKPTVDLAALIEASADASLELSGSMGDLMAASRTFIEAHGVAAMNELRAAVAPDPNNSAVGLSVGSLTPAQRALVQACIQNYPS